MSKNDTWLKENLLPWQRVTLADGTAVRGDLVFYRELPTGREYRRATDAELIRHLCDMAV